MSGAVAKKILMNNIDENTRELIRMSQASGRCKLSEQVLMRMELWLRAQAPAILELPKPHYDLIVDLVNQVKQELQLRTAEDKPNTP